MPVPLLIALFLAFGLDSPRGMLPDREVPIRTLEALAGVLGVGLLAVGIGAWVAWRISVYGYMTTRTRRFQHLAGLVGANWGLRGWFLIGHLAVIAPYLAMQVFLWCGQFLVERAISTRGRYDATFRLWPYLVLKGRNALGLVLPVVLVFLIRQDLIGRIWPEWTENAVSEPVDFAVLGCFVLCISPLFVRLAFPTRSLPDGPLRQRLEHLARRVGFRFRDILIWETDHRMVNACVTGVLPGFRYVLLTDALIDTLEPREISAVFGHEIGHIAHRHLPYFGFFFLGSLGVLTLASAGIAGFERWLVAIPSLSGLLDPSWSDLIEMGLVLMAVALFFGLAFGHLSRRFERQADVFGCAVVSCSHEDCPPHDDPDEGPAPITPGRRVAFPCPTGIRIFANALKRVADQNGIPFRARSWRHGSIANRIAFLESLDNNPGKARQFETGIRRLRIRWGILLVASILLAMGSHVFSIMP